MYCPYCGKENRDDAKFCAFCGRPTIRRPETYRPPAEPENQQNVSQNPSQTYYNVPQQNPNNPKKKNPLPWIILISCIVVLLLGIAIFIVYSKMKQEQAPLETNTETTVVSDDNSEEDSSSRTSYYGDGAAAYLEEMSDMEAYFQQRGEIISITDAKTSDKIETEKAVAANLSSRGFDQYPITYEYSLDGEYSRSAEASADSNEKHPTYETYYMTKAGSLWTIFEVNGQVTAYPASYNMESDQEAETMIAETTAIMSYDSGSNKFYETIPKPSAMIVKTVDRIDAETLEKLTNDKIDRL